MRTIDDLMKLWPTVADFARDVGIKPTHAQTMRVRRSIPVEYWPNILAAAKARNLNGITADTLMKLRESRRRCWRRFSNAKR